MAHACLGDHNRAQAAYLEGLQRARAMPFPYGEAHLLHAQGLLDRQEGDQTAAHAKFSAALAIFETMGAERDATRLCEMM